MPHTRIKICGITRAQDAATAAACGADSIGMVFYRSARRCITLETARQVLASLPPFVTPVGLFVNSPPDEIIQIASALGLRHLQLHGDEYLECVRRLEGYAVIKAVRVTKTGFRSELDKWRQAIQAGLPQLRGFVLETAGDGVGGTGISNDWQTVREAKQVGAFDGLPAIIAAGGLTPHNVARVVRDIQPWAVDVSSGVEAEFGIKSKEKIEAFVGAVKAADHLMVN